MVILKSQVLLVEHLKLMIQGSQLIFKIQFAETDNGKEWFYLYANKIYECIKHRFYTIRI